MVRHLKTLLKYSYYCCVVSLVLCALLLQAARSFIGYIDHYRLPIQAYISEQTGTEVTLDKLAAHWQGLRPKVSVQGVSVTAAEQTLLSASRAEMEVDILASLWRTAVVWRAVEFDDLALTAVQDAQGDWSIAGFASPFRATAAADQRRAWRYRSPGDLFLSVKSVTLRNTRLTLLFRSEQQLQATVPAITIRNDGHFHRLSASTAIGDTSVFNFHLEGEGNPAVPESFQAKAYLQLTHFPIGRLLELFSSTHALPVVSNAVVNSQLWFDFHSPKAFLFSGNVNYSGDAQGNSVFDIPLRARLGGSYQLDRGWDVNVRNLTVDSLTDLAPVQIRLQHRQLALSTARVDVSAWSQWLAQQLPDHSLGEALSGLSPSGELENLHVSAPLAHLTQLQMQANVNQASIENWQQVPALSNVSGFVESDLHSGFILVDTVNFAFYPAQIYRQPLLAKRAQGRIGWSLSPAENAIKIYGDGLTLSGDYGQARGYFLVDTPLEAASRESLLSLQIGLRDSRALAYKQLLPTLLPEDLQHWMATAIKAGEVAQAGLLYRGGFRQDSARAIQLFVDVERAHLAYDPQWPALKNISGRLLVDNQQVFAQVHKAEVYAGDVAAGTLVWNGDFQKALALDAEIKTSVPSGLRFVKASVLQQQTAGVLDDWSGAGALDVDLSLRLPLLDSSAPVQQTVRLQFADNRLDLRAQNLQLSQLSGVLSYSDATGFSSSNLQASLFKQPLALALLTEGDVLRLSGVGRAASEELSAWLQQPLDRWLTGEFDYLLDLTIPTAQSSQTASPIALSLFSDLQGVAINLPPPLKKAAVETRNFIVNGRMQADGWHYQATLGNHLAATLRASRQGMIKADVLLADKETPVVTQAVEDGVRFKAQLQRADALAWMALVESYPASESAGVALPMRFDIAVDQLFYHDIEVANVVLSGQREASGWSAIIDADGIQGGLYWDSDRRTPAIVDLDYLHWPLTPVLSAQDAAPDGFSHDPWADVTLATLKPLDVRIEQLVYREKLLGQWSFAVRPQRDRLAVTNIVGAVGGFSFAGEDDNSGAHLSWQRDPEGEGMGQTRLRGYLRGGSLQALFDLWDLQPLLVNQQATAAVDLSWLGSPAFFSVDRLQGETAMSLRDGVFIENQATSATGALRLLGLFNFDTWLRRMRLDFSDVFNKGLSFDRLSGTFAFDKGLIRISEPFSLTGPSVSMQLDGTIDYPTQTLDGNLAVVLPVGGNLTLATALTAGLPAAAALYVVRQLFKREVDKASTVNYTVTGKWNAPSINVRDVDGEDVEAIIE